MKHEYWGVRKDEKGRRKYRGLEFSPKKFSSYANANQRTFIYKKCLIIHRILLPYQLFLVKKNIGYIVDKSDQRLHKYTN